MKTKILLLLAILLAGSLLAEPMPEFKLPNESGKSVNLTELLGRGPVIVDFWADYCQPCKQAMPALDALAQKYDSLTVVLISIDAPKAQTKAKNYLKGKNFKFVSLFDPDQTLAKKLNVAEPPHTFILDKAGEIVLEHKGFVTGDEKEYELKVRSLLGFEEEIGHECVCAEPCENCDHKEKTEAAPDQKPAPEKAHKSPCGNCH